MERKQTPFVTSWVRGNICLLSKKMFSQIIPVILYRCFCLPFFVVTVLTCRNSDNFHFQ